MSKKIITPEWVKNYRTFSARNRAFLRFAVADFIHKTARNEVEFSVSEKIAEASLDYYHNRNRFFRLSK